MSHEDLVAQLERFAAELRRLRDVASAAKDLLLAWPKPGQVVQIPSHRIRRLATALLEAGIGVDGTLGGGSVSRR